MHNEHTQRLAALLGNLSAVELAFDAVIVLAIPGLFEAISRRDESEVGRLIVQAVIGQLSEDVTEAIEMEQERAQAIDEAEHAECNLPDEFQDWLHADPFSRMKPSFGPRIPVNQADEE